MAFAEGGLARIVWLPKALKEQISERLNESAKELYGIDNFSDMIADGAVGRDDIVTATMDGENIKLTVQQL